MVRLLVSRQPKGFFKPDSGRSCRIRSRMVRAVSLPVIGFAVIGAAPAMILVGPDGGEAYNGHADVFVENSRDVMHRLNGFLPNLLSQWLKSQKSQAAPPDASHVR